MGLNIADIVEYLNKAVQLKAVPKSKEVLAGTIAFQGLQQRIGVSLETAAGRRMGFAEDEIPVSLAYAVDDTDVVPSLRANKHRIGFTGTVTAGETIRVGNSTFEFAATVASDPEFIPVSVGTGAPSVCAANLLTQYNLFPAVANATLVNTTTLAFEHGTVAFEVAAKMEEVSIGAVVEMRDGVASVNLSIPAGAPVTTGDEFNVTFGPVTRADGRSLDAVLASISVV